MLQIVCASSMDTFQIFTWSLKTGRLLEALAGHEGPIVGLSFNPNLPFLASASWDKTVSFYRSSHSNAFYFLAPPLPGSMCLPLDSFFLSTVYWASCIARGSNQACPGSSTDSLLRAPQVRTWDVFGGKGSIESLQHNHDVLAVCYRPDGKQVRSFPCQSSSARFNFLCLLHGFPFADCNMSYW